ncbi:MAG: LamG-like jellyroll fold domain-containing protein, partial [Gammaproteobacteria bacterium]
MATTAYSFQPGASDADGDQLTFSISKKPAWASFNTGNGRLSGTPADNHVGTTSNIVISVSDGTDSASLPAFSLAVTALPNSGPVINSIAPQDGALLVSYSVDEAFSYAEFFINGTARGDFDTDSDDKKLIPGLINGVTYIITMVAYDANFSPLPVSNQVSATPEAPTRVTANLVSFYPFAERTGNVVHDLSGSASPMDLTISGSVNWYGAGNGMVMNGGRVGTEGPATDLINALRASNTSTFEIWVEPANITQAGPARMISVGGDTTNQNFMLGQIGDDVEARLLHTGKQSQNDPGLATNNGVLDASLVHLVHTYDGSEERLYINGVQQSQTIAAAGGYGNWDMSQLFSIGNEATSNQPYNGIIRLVAVYDRPLDTAEIQQNFASGPAATGDAGGVEGANSVPLISGTPAGSVVTDESDDFQPVASDADGDALAFSITGKPAWATFDTTTGRLSGTPAFSDAGTYSNIVILVTDGVDTISLGAFSIQVSEGIQLGSFSLSWTAPTTRSDGTPLSLADINGYRIHYGTSPSDYTDT